MAVQEVVNLIQDHLRGAWRFRWIALAVAVAVCGIGWAIVFTLPDKYGASARVYVDAKTALSEVTKGIGVQVSVESQIDRVTEKMLSAPLLQRVGDETDLFRGATTPQQKQGRINQLRNQIKIKSLGNNGGVYTIEYQNSDRDMSLRVVDKLVSVFVGGTLGGKQSSSQKAQDFLAEQIKDYNKRLSEAENAVAEFKKKNFGVMPAAQGDYFSRLQAEMAEVQRLEGELQTAEQEGVTLKAQLNGQQQYVSKDRTSGADSSGSANVQRLRDQEARLAELELKYTDKYPEIVSLRNTIAELKQRVAEEQAAARRGDSIAAASAGLGESPVYQQIRADINKNEVAISKLKTELNRRRSEVARLRGNMDTSADVEAKYQQLNRDYEVTKQTYQELLQRQEQTHVGDQAEQAGMMAFEIIDPPHAPYDPVSPQRPVLITLVLVLALGAGGGVAYLLHLLKPVYFHSRALAAATGLPVIGVVPFTLLDRHRAAFRREVFKYSTVLAGLVLFAVLVVSQQARLTALAKGFL